MHRKIFQIIVELHRERETEMINVMFAEDQATLRKTVGIAMTKMTHIPDRIVHLEAEDADEEAEEVVINHILRMDVVAISTSIYNRFIKAHTKTIHKDLIHMNIPVQRLIMLLHLYLKRLIGTSIRLKDWNISTMNHTDSLSNTSIRAQSLLLATANAKRTD